MKKLLILLSCCGTFMAIQPMYQSKPCFGESSQVRKARWLVPELFQAVSSGEIEKVRNMVAKGISKSDLKNWGDTLIVIAAHEGYEEIVTILFRAAGLEGTGRVETVIFER